LRKFLAILIIDVILQNLHDLWRTAPVESEWYVWGLCCDLRFILIPVLLWLSFSYWQIGLKLATGIYVILQSLDFVQFLTNNRSTVWLDFSLVVFAMVFILFKWDKWELKSMKELLEIYKKEKML